MTSTEGGADNDLAPTVEITTSGRGGSYTYREGAHSIAFDMEFGMAPELALAWGPKRAEWDARYPWAIGRQAAIYAFVGAEVVRQKAPGGAAEFDLELGHLTILNETGARARGLYVSNAAAAAKALKEYSSADARLAGAEETLRTDPSAFETMLAREVRRLYLPEDGLERVLSLAASHPTEPIRQALLWASYNGTLCAQRCAGLLLVLTGAASEPFDSDVQLMLSKLGKHTSDFARDEGFADLCRRVGMVLDRSPQD
jgi:hypothetical protein